MDAYHGRLGFSQVILLTSEFPVLLTIVTTVGIAGDGSRVLEREAELCFKTH